MANEHETATQGTCFSRPSQLHRQADDDGPIPIQTLRNFGIEFDSHPIKRAEPLGNTLKIGLTDSYQFSRECLTALLDSLHPRPHVVPFTSMQDCLAQQQTGLDLVVYYSHAGNANEAAMIRDVAAFRQAFPDIPLLILSDVEDAHQPQTIRSMLENGAHGLIPTRTTGVMIAIAAIRFVKAGGTFAPLDLLLTNEPAAPTAARRNQLTSRQMAVLSHLKQGKANKLIAHELNMSESTVKVHVRNIMRKTGATNRTQAAYKAQQLWRHIEPADMADM